MASVASVASPPTAAAISGNHSQSAPQPHMHSIQLLHNAMAGGMPHGLGLLTTVASLPPKYRSRYLNIKTKCEIPLDLSVKPASPVTQAVIVAEAELPQEVAQEVVVITEKATFTPPQSPAAIVMPIEAAAPVKRKLSESSELQPAAKLHKTVAEMPTVTTVVVPAPATPPSQPIKVTDTAPRTGKTNSTNTTTTTNTTTSSAKSSRNKATRKLKFDEETSSPVSGTIIRPLEDITDGIMQYSNGDIDPKYNIVEVTEETKAELAAIKNVIGDYVCRLCRIRFDDAFELARHRCACIVLLEYRCPECGKQFNCPANLASHRRWHKPKKETAAKKENRQQQALQQLPVVAPSDEQATFGCNECGKQFKRAAYLRKHQQTHAKKQKQEGQQVQTEQQTGQQTGQQQEYFALPTTTTTTITGSFQTSVYKSGSSHSSSSGSSSSHSYADEGVYVAGVGGTSSSHYDYDGDYMSDCSSSTNSSAGYGRLQIVEHGLTEEESIAAAALTNLRNCASVIQHTTMAH